MFQIRSVEPFVFCGCVVRAGFLCGGRRCTFGNIINVKSVRVILFPKTSLIN
ncbi:MAG: hypothetical protein LBT09_05850 [Planctomycetaceae bacterium]|nr:hypothetical protein [Planctomycetaceae bacterium]